MFKCEQQSTDEIYFGTYLNFGKSALILAPNPLIGLNELLLSNGCLAVLHNRNDMVADLLFMFL